MLCFLDAASWTLALAMASATRPPMVDSALRWPGLIGLALTAIGTSALLSQLPRYHFTQTRRGSMADAQNVATVWSLTVPIVLIANHFLFERPLPTMALVLALPMALTTMLGARFAWRTLYDRFGRRTEAADKIRVLVFGAGEGGEQIIRAMRRDPGSAYMPVGLLDDDPAKANRRIEGIEVVGTRSDIARAAGRYSADELLIAMPIADAALVTELDELGRAAGLGVRVLPSTSELLGLLSLDDIRQLTDADLLGRAEVEVNLDSIKAYVAGRRVLVTGAGGSIGSELCRQISGLNPAELYMLDQDETNLHGVQLSIEGKALLDTPSLIVANIRDADRVDEVFSACKPEVVFHTAALKHLTLLENHPEEAMKTNVLGTANLLHAAMRHDVARFVNVSTDKAANPTSILGASKLAAERLTALAAKASGLPFVSVRFGNVLGSRGSVLPTFRQQIELGGPVTVTDPDATRYFMTVPEAVRLVLQSGAIGRPGEIMILDMGNPVNIAQLAQKLIDQSGKKIDIVYTGLRHGEKMHEVLVGTHEVGANREHSRITHTAGSTDFQLRGEVGEALLNKLDLQPLSGALSAYTETTIGPA